MKVALAGKGGTGKTSLSGTLARSFGRDGRRVLAIDCDSNPNLATSLGLAPELTGRLRSMPKRAFDEGRTVSDLLAEYSVAAPDGVHLVLAARVDQAGAG